MIVLNGEMDMLKLPLDITVFLCTNQFLYGPYITVTICKKKKLIWRIIHETGMKYGGG